MMNKYDQALHHEIFITKEYSFADQEIKEAKTIFDIGAHKGYFSDYCLSLNPLLEIHLFEPNPEQVEYLLSSYEGEDTIYINSF